MRFMVASLCALGLGACASSSSSVNSIGGFRLHIEQAEPVAPSDVEVADTTSVPVSDAARPSLISTSAAADAAESSHQVMYVNLAYGERRLRASEAKDLGIDKPTLYGFEFDSTDTETGLGYEAGIDWAGDHKHGLGWNTSDTYVGGRYTLNTDGWLQPYVGVGLSFLWVTVDTGNGLVNDYPWGPYFRAGLSTVFGRVRFGLDYRTAYRVVGRAVAAAVEGGGTELTADLLSAASEEITGAPMPDAVDALAATKDPIVAVSARDAPGAASPRRVREHARHVLRRVTAAQRWNAGRRARIAEAESALLEAARGLLD